MTQLQKLTHIVLSNKHNMQVELVDFGARIVSIKVPNKHQKIIETTYSDKRDEEIVNDTAFKGATCGRVANRIGNAAFTIGQSYFQLVANEGKNILHGGANGFSHKRWRVAMHHKRHDVDMVVFELASADEEEGFPGNMLAKVTYRLFANNELNIEFSAECDKLCPINMCNHVYFNLGESSIADLSIQVNAKQVLEVDKSSIPTGICNPVDHLTDLNTPVKLRHILKKRDLDDCFVLNKTGVISQLSEAASLVSNKNGIVLTILTDQIGLQVYSGNYLVPKHAAIALEAQGLPDAVNHKSLITEWVGPKQAYKRFVSYRFESC